MPGLFLWLNRKSHQINSKKNFLIFITPILLSLLRIVDDAVTNTFISSGSVDNMVVKTGLPFKIGMQFSHFKGATAFVYERWGNVAVQHGVFQAGNAAGRGFLL